MSEVTIKTHAEGQAWIRSQKSIWSTPGIILFNGPMGAGKTQMVRWILEELGSQDAASPTFALHHRYITKTMPVDHFDLYRMESDFELENTSFWDMMNEPDNLMLVEWADRLPADAFPQDRRIVSIHITLMKDGLRKVRTDF